ncbi:MAG TPA: phosphoglycerate dehydrogenase [Bdellovibrionota bacterium]|jgi:D-3-phosphoglycerate dehydrogenase|nr:phosphoglycerate dehydrogenase [Bdellovibrionota bacterium]
MKILVTCPPMIGRIEHYGETFRRKGWDVFCPQFKQVMGEAELKKILPEYDGWIIGDDPANRAVFGAGAAGRLKAAVRWGVGVDNVDFAAAKELQIPIENTPGVFGAEVADVALGYVVMLARSLHKIDQSVRSGKWFKPAGQSLAGKVMGVVGLGDIGRNVVKRALGFDFKIIGYDPFATPASLGELAPRVQLAKWPERLGELDYLVFACALTPENRHMLNAERLAMCKAGMSIVNVARGPLIQESALIEALRAGHIGAAGLDVFEKEPLDASSELLKFENVIVGSHNSSNTVEAVDKVSHMAIDKMERFLREKGALHG